MYKNEKLISVVMSVYNEKDDYLKKSINSILNQTYKNIQFIIVIDDPLNENMCKIIRQFEKKDNRIEVITNEKNLGLTASLNKALKQCNGEYIARMDSDDIAELNRLELQVEFLEKEYLDLVSSEVRHIDSNDNIICLRTNVAYSPNCIKKTIKYGNTIAHPTWLFRRKIVEDLVKYRDMPACEDYDFLLRIINKGYKIGTCNKILLNYRINENGISRKNLLKQFIASNYIGKRIKKINDLSEENVKEYVKNKCNEKEIRKYDKAVVKFELAFKLLNEKNIKFIYELICAFFLSKYMRIRLVNISLTKLNRIIYN